MGFSQQKPSSYPGSPHGYGYYEFYPIHMPFQIPFTDDFPLRTFITWSSKKYRGTPIAGWFLLWKIPSNMDDNWGYPYFRKPPYVTSGHRRPRSAKDLSGQSCHRDQVGKPKENVDECRIYSVYIYIFGIYAYLFIFICIFKCIFIGITLYIYIFY